jgi:hypothetical protein
MRTKGAGTLIFHSIKNSRAAESRDFHGFDFQLTAQQRRQGKSEPERERIQPLADKISLDGECEWEMIDMRRSKIAVLLIPCCWLAVGTYS